MDPRLQDLLHWCPWHPGDPGPEIWRMINTLPEQNQHAAIKVITEANAKILDVKAGAFRELGNIMSGKAR